MGQEWRGWECKSVQISVLGMCEGNDREHQGNQGIWVKLGVDIQGWMCYTKDNRTFVYRQGHRARDVYSQNVG